MRKRRPEEASSVISSAIQSLISGVPTSRVLADRLLLNDCRGVQYCGDKCPLAVWLSKILTAAGFTEFRLAVCNDVGLFFPQEDISASIPLVKMLRVFRQEFDEGRYPELILR